jgi:hypothetical protein
MIFSTHLRRKCMSPTARISSMISRSGSLATATLNPSRATMPDE